MLTETGKERRYNKIHNEIAGLQGGGCVALDAIRVRVKASEDIEEG
jgi:hypothetical protein